MDQTASLMKVLINEPYKIYNSLKPENIFIQVHNLVVSLMIFMVIYSSWLIMDYIIT